ncbi:MULTISPECIES: hypothetical protein [unclassified Curtobacterium]|uniref:hypothetical protein n=1 Tax=unclassified Curtobacterium TaxID=257496 RepID=UPI0011B35842|nr:MULTISPECIES: hypothetical protein [unclassified Curtobacterium]WIB63753.1 hypothetical protein DEI94_00775 [Curtobacterium sp. MCBD17_040]
MIDDGTRARGNIAHAQRLILLLQSGATSFRVFCSEIENSLRELDGYFDAHGSLIDSWEYFETVNALMLESEAFRPDVRTVEQHVNRLRENLMRLSETSSGE